MKCLNYALNIYPENCRMLNTKGEILMNMDEPDSAMDIFNKALSLCRSDEKQMIEDNHLKCFAKKNRRIVYRQKL